ncbi:MAG TPA: CehA/McbA family metallohydrolase [Gemmataceae bacterium]|nr:CehA/McbA family metallohydrolase [Gemmataceae bacterium]
MRSPLRLLLSVVLALLVVPPAPAAELPKVTKVELQPLAAQVQRVADALDFVGNPLPAADKDALRKAAADSDQARAIETIQSVLDKHCLAGVRIGKNNELDVEPGPARAELAEQGWRVFLIKVENAAGLSNVELRPSSPNALPMYRGSSGRPDPKVVSVGEVAHRFLDLMMFNTQPLIRHLSGLELEYRVLQIYCRDSGRKEAQLAFGLWRDTDKSKPLATSNPLAIAIDSLPAVLVALRVVDADGRPTTGSFVFRDQRGRVYPSQSRRLAPDFGFHPQVYRHYGETIALQPGQYSVAYTRGPEYLTQQRTITVPAVATHAETFELKRWIHPAAKGWYSGDHHVHAAGCAHYESPTEGVTPEDMMRHVLGEDLDVGCCLSWGPCWYHQKRYFEGKTNALSTPDHLLRYDVEVSGFPSSHCGHICLLRLREQDYPGTKLIEDWPSWDLPIFRWAKAQNSVVGFAHSGWGLDVGSTSQLPNFTVPPMDGIGANEYLVDVAHNLCDFISTVDTPSVWELNIWYHTLNCGYRCRISGETDFPCIYGERVGLGRSYVHLDGKLTFDDWAEGIKQGRCYVSDGKSHLMDFTVNGLDVGRKNSEVRLDKPANVEVRARVAALLELKPTPASEAIRKAPLTAKPYWDIERARISDTRKVPVELVINGKAVEKKEIVADGSEQEVVFSAPIEASSWVCLRIFPSSHTNPVFVVVDGKPIRASKRSADWCLKAIDRCWQQKSRRIRAQEKDDAAKAYEAARVEYRKILSESAAD